MSRTYIVVLTWNNSQDWAACVGSLRLNTYAPAGLVLVDNGSSGENWLSILATMRSLQGDPVQLCSLISNRHNRGIPAAQNQALRLLADLEPEPYGVLLLDADTVVQPHWLSKILSFAEAHPDVGVVGGAKSVQGYAHPVYHHVDGRWYVHDKQCEDPSGFMGGESVDFACAYLRPELIARGLLFDERYEIYDGYDQDLSFRVRSWGYRVVQIDAGVLHYGSAAMKANDYQWRGGGRQEWDALRTKNVKRFADTWSSFLATRRHSVAAEAEHMATMNAKLVAEAGELKEIP